VPLGSPLRYVAAAALLTAAAVHLAITGDHLEEATYIGILFILLSVALCVEAALIVNRDDRRVWLASALTCGLAFVAFVWSRSIGLPQIREDIGGWTEPLGIVALFTEGLVVLFAWAALTGRDRNLSVPRSPAGAGLVALVIGLGATAVAAASPAQQEAHDRLHGGMSMSDSSYWSDVEGSDTSGGVTRTYYISADPVVWDYAPKRHDVLAVQFEEESEEGQEEGEEEGEGAAGTYIDRGPGRIGSQYEKCLYQGYTDGTFSKQIERPLEERYLGFLGPVIRAEVGDTIKVVFRNQCPFLTSVHPHGVFYTKGNEGAPYDDGTNSSDKPDDAIPTGATHTYTWEVPERAGPGPDEGSSVMWMYHGHTNEVTDMYAGLMGPMEITRRGEARDDGSPKDVDREIFALFSVMNENESPFLQRNISRFALPPLPDPADEGFQESNLMHAINGYVYGNQPMIRMNEAERVRWYVMGMGSEPDLHTPHWHGNTVTVHGMRMDTIDLLPATMVVADMVPDDPGIWLFHCHVADHILAGMQTRYRVN
jgi:Multicopper oxidase